MAKKQTALERRRQIAVERDELELDRARRGLVGSGELPTVAQRMAKHTTTAAAAEHPTDAYERRVKALEMAVQCWSGRSGKTTAEDLVDGAQVIERYLRDGSLADPPAE